MMFGLISLIFTSLIVHKTFSEEASKLIFIQTLTRHGDRAPVLIYPTDPNRNDSWPEGLGKLTLLGKKQQYALGKFLRSKYQDFITTNPSEVSVNSSALERCLSSAAATLASFYAPEGRWKIKDGLNWQPIPIHYQPLKQDKYLSYQGSCPRAEAEFSRQFGKIRHLYQKYEAQLDELSNHTGMNVSRGINAFYLHDTLRVEKMYNLTIPEWADFYMNELQEIADGIFQSATASPLMIKMRMGPLLQDISENMKRKRDGDIPDLKVQMHFAHDANLAAALLALNFSDMPKPPYCATLIFELHELPDTTMAVRLLYLNSTDPIFDMGNTHVLVLDGCSEFCPLENFSMNLQHLIPENWEQECQLNASDTSDPHKSKID